ncbi:MAG: hypothetical protein FJY95_04695 [Candidatus Handelsmanbacteria bacterium]|nr:hypothetical protein [Candidatus Handelsmanbacteria bacterium]
MLIALAILLGLGLALFLLPVLIALRVETPGPGGQLDLRLSWGFWLGGAGVQLRLQGGNWQLRPLLLGLALPFPRLRLAGGEEEIPPPAAPEAPVPPLPEGKAAGPPPKRPELGRLAREGFRPALRLLRRLAGTLRLRRLRLQGRFGLADPAATGQVFGWLQGARGLLPGRLRLELSPDFVHQGVRGTAHLALHFYLGAALYLLASFGARIAWRWWGLRRAARRPTTPSTRR